MCRINRSMEVIWFRNGHEHRNDLLRFGFMRMHRWDQLSFTQLPLGACVEHGFSAVVAGHEHRHSSVLLVREGSRVVRCLIDSEDSFYWMSPLVSEVDLYFCAGYSPALFERGQFPEPYSWQMPEEVAFYERRICELLDRFGDHFGHVRRFVPIGPNMARSKPMPRLAQRLHNARHKALTAAGVKNDWRSELQVFEARYRELLALRASPLLYDVTLLDTLWGWPRHRLALHERLAALSDRFQIHSTLNWSDPVAMDGSSAAPLDRARFPLTTRPVDKYETMLASSRLGVFATGFHWGWRNVMMLALMIGLPVYSDRLILQPWFDMSGFEIWWNDSNNWPYLPDLLSQIDNAAWGRIRTHNQSFYDSVMAPEQVARYVIRTALA